jgi:uncharacterized membrane protein
VSESEYEMKRLIVFILLLVFVGCGTPTAETYIKKCKAAQKKPMAEAITETFKITVEASEKLSPEEHTKFLNYLIDEVWATWEE